MKKGLFIIITIFFSLSAIALNSFNGHDKKASKHKLKGEVFLKENKLEEGIILLESGLQYKILKKGEGSIPKETDRVTVHYKGTHLNGKVFDSSYERGEAFNFKVNGVIRGWTQALTRMPVGSKWIIYIPSELGYGINGHSKVIAPNEVLIFEIELIAIK